VAPKMTTTAKKTTAKPTAAAKRTAASTHSATSKNGTARSGQPASFTVPGMAKSDGARVAKALQERLVALLDMTLTLKHVHWNVVGRDFIGVHLMLDPQYAAVSEMVDTVAERIATLGESPNGLAGHLVTARTWDDYALGRAVVPQHLAELDVAYSGIIGGHRAAIESVSSVDPISEDILIGQCGQLEQFQWFVRAHLENGDGAIVTATDGRAAARQAS